MPSKTAGTQILFIGDEGEFEMSKQTVREQSKQLSLMLDKKTYEQKPVNIIRLVGTPADDLEKLEHFFKTGSYIMHPEAATEKKDTIVEAIQMFALGDKYGIGNLKHQAKDNLKQVLDPDWTEENFLIALDTICTYLPCTTELKGMVLGQVASFEISVATNLFEDYEKEGGFNTVCEKFKGDGVDIRRDLTVLQEKVLKEVKDRYAYVPGLKCADCWSIDTLSNMDSAKGEYYCYACKKIVSGKAPGEWIR